MRVVWRVVLWIVVGCSLMAEPVVATEARGAAGEHRARNAAKEVALRHPVLWRDPGSIAELDLFHGPGGKDGMPVPPFTFEQEDRGGGSPRFDAHDGTGRRWSVGVGRDARPEVAASRLLWAAGYLADDDYVLFKATVSGLRLRNGKRYLRRGFISDARFARKVDGQKKLGVWRWRNNAFTGTRELNGLRVMMALLNCWDLKDENNPIVEDPGSSSELFRVSGLGASLGKAGPRLFRGKAQDNAKSFARSSFITKRTETYVDFATPSRSYNPLALFSRRSGSVWVGRQIPRKDAKWIGTLLGQLTHKQIEDAFWAAGYSVNDVNLFANVVDGRIRALVDL